MSKDHQIAHKIGNAVITESAVDQLQYWQDHDNDSLQGMVCNLLKAVSFIACTASSYAFIDKDKAESMNHIINLSETAKTIEVFMK